ncbi:MAG: Ig-like domain-containing protein [Acutalibacteraceae bacterium]
MKKAIKKIVPVLLAITLIFTVASYSKASAKDYTCTSPKLQQLINEWSGVYWTGSFRTATTCKGFADMMFNELYGNGGVGAYNSGAYSYYVPTPRAATEIARLSSAGYQDFYNIMHKAASGDYIQWATAYSQHSSIFLSCDENGFYVFDSNYVEPYLCTVHYITYDYISSVTYGVSLYRSTSSEAYVAKKVEKKKEAPKVIPFEFAEKKVELTYMETYNPTVNGGKKITSWTSSNDNVAVVSNEGVIEGVSGGTAIITAINSEGKSTQMTVEVEDTSVKRIIGVLLDGFKPIDVSGLAL